MKGVRSQFSNHSFGTAVDINPGSNGLYDQCDVPRIDEKSIKRCRLRIGGKWNPGKRPSKTIVRDGPVHQAFTRFWKWGGEIGGNTKDMMHFSLTGY